MKHRQHPDAGRWMMVVAAAAVVYALLLSHVVLEADALYVTFHGDVTMGRVPNPPSSQTAPPYLYIYEPFVPTESEFHYVLNHINCTGLALGGMHAANDVGYETSITFLDADHRVLAAFGDSYFTRNSLSSGVHDQPVVFPSIGQVRIRSFKPQTFAEISIDITSQSYVPIDKMYTTFGSNWIGALRIDSSVAFSPNSFGFRCTSPSATHTQIHIRVVGVSPNSTYDDLLRPLHFSIFGSAIPQSFPEEAIAVLGAENGRYPNGYLDLFGLGRQIDFVVSATPMDESQYFDVRYRCIQVQRPLAVNLSRSTSSPLSPPVVSVARDDFGDVTSPENPRMLSPPFVLLSDVDGSYTSHSRMPQMELNGMQEFALLQLLANASSPSSADRTGGNDLCISLTGERDAFLHVTLLRTALTPSIIDTTWGSPGYRTILSLLTRNGSTLMALDGARVGYRIMLPSLNIIRLRTWFGASEGGFTVQVECEEMKVVERIAFPSQPLVVQVYASTAESVGTVTVSQLSQTLLQCPPDERAAGAEVVVILPPNIEPGRDVVFAGSQMTSYGTAPPFAPSPEYYRAMFSTNGSLRLRSTSNTSRNLWHRCVYVYRTSGSSALGVTDGAVLHARQRIRLPAIISSDIDFGSNGSWASYPDMGTETVWELDASSACNGAFEAPHLRRLEFSMQPNMQDASWGTPGYRTIFSFLDTNGTLIVSFGHTAELSVVDVSLPQLKYIRLRVWGGWSGPGFILELSCRSVETQPANGVFSRFTAQRVTLLPDRNYGFACLEGNEPVVLLSFSDVLNSLPRATRIEYVSEIRSRLIGATLPFDTFSSADTSDGQFAMAVAPSGLVSFVKRTTGRIFNVTHRCVYLHRPCPPDRVLRSLLGPEASASSRCVSGGGRLPLMLPAFFLSDADGPFGTSFTSYPDLREATEWSLDVEGSRACKAPWGSAFPAGYTGVGPYLSTLNASMMPNMIDGSWGSPGYRTIITFLGNRSNYYPSMPPQAASATTPPVVLLSIGHHSNEQLPRFMSLPSLSAVRLRTWFGQSAPGFVLELGCAEQDVELASSRSNITVHTFTGTFEQQIFTLLNYGGHTVTVTCPSVPTDDVDAGEITPQVEFDLRKVPSVVLADLTSSVSFVRFVNASFLCGNMDGSTCLAYSHANVASVVATRDLPMSIVIYYRCVFVHRPCAIPITPTAAPASCATPLRFPAVIMSDLDGHGERSWMSYADHVRDMLYSNSLAEETFRCDASKGEFPELTRMNLATRPGMQEADGDGYRTLISFRDTEDAVLLGFGHRETQQLEFISLPTLGSIRVQTSLQQSAPGYVLHLQCRRRCSTVAMDFRVQAPISFAFPSGQCSRVRCSPGASVHLQKVSGPGVVGRIIGATWLGAEEGAYSTASDGAVDLELTLPVAFSLRCVFVYAGCSPLRPARLGLRLPAVILGDSDGSANVSWFPLPSTQRICTYEFADHTQSPYMIGREEGFLRSGRIQSIVSTSFAPRPVTDASDVLIYGMPMNALILSSNVSKIINAVALSTILGGNATFVRAIRMYRRGLRQSDAGFSMELAGFLLTPTPTVSLSASPSSSIPTASFTELTNSSVPTATTSTDWSNSNVSGSTSPSNTKTSSRSISLSHLTTPSISSLATDSDELTETRRIPCAPELVPKLSLMTLLMPVLSVAAASSQHNSTDTSPVAVAELHEPRGSPFDCRCAAAELHETDASPSVCTANASSTAAAAASSGAWVQTELIMFATSGTTAFVDVDRTRLPPPPPIALADNASAHHVSLRLLLALRPGFGWVYGQQESTHHAFRFLLAISRRLVRSYPRISQPSMARRACAMTPCPALLAARSTALLDLRHGGSRCNYTSAARTS